jgi:orotate phosphoribosyltransferase
MLKNIIATKSFRSGQFTLASGQTSNYFFDLKPTMLDPVGSNLIADAMLDRMATWPNIAAVGGMATGGIPLVAVITALSHHRGTPIPGFFVRQATKDHGTEQRIEGSVLEAGQTVVLVEDVTTTGESILRAVRCVRAAACHVHDVITVVDRQEGATHNLFSAGITLWPLFLRTDFG